MRRQCGRMSRVWFEEVESCLEREKGFREVIDTHNASTKGGKIEIVQEIDQAVLLGAVFLIDFVHFENNGKRN